MMEVRSVEKKEETEMAFDMMVYVQEAKAEFDRTVECKHTSFDDLYPYMLEQQSFFWYKRHAAWAALLATVKVAIGADVQWQELFSEKQLAMLEKKILDKTVLDEWLETVDSAVE
jgi:hypothetical protein